MTGAAGSRFRLSWSQRTLDEVKSLARRAADRGLAGWMAAAFRDVKESLETDPVGWGDPLLRLRHAKLLLCHRALDQHLVISNAVDEQHRVVYVQKITPMPGTPLAED